MREGNRGKGGVRGEGLDHGRSRVVVERNFHNPAMSEAKIGARSEWSEERAGRGASGGEERSDKRKIASYSRGRLLLSLRSSPPPSSNLTSPCNSPPPSSTS